MPRYATPPTLTPRYATPRLLPILIHRYLVKYGPGQMTFLTRIHSNRGIYLLGLSPLFYRFVYLYNLTWHYIIM